MKPFGYIEEELGSVKNRKQRGGHSEWPISLLHLYAVTPKSRIASRFGRVRDPLYYRVVHLK